MPNRKIARDWGSSENPEWGDFTSLQWLVVAIGARDGSVPLQWSRFGRALLVMIGGNQRPLASPCLEVLRSTAKLARRFGWAMPSADVGVFLRSGWSEAQLERLIESVGQNEPALKIGCAVKHSMASDQVSAEPE